MSLVLKVKNSATLMTWASLFSRMGMVVFILPLILIEFDELEISIWFLFIILTRIRDIFDFGLLDNIARTYSYAYKNDAVEDGSGLEYQKIYKIKDFSKNIYKKATLLCLISLSIIGFSVLIYKVGIHQEAFVYWISLALLILSSSFFIYGNQYVAIFVGLNQIALVKYWDTIFSTLNIISLILVLLVHPSFMLVIIVNSLWIVLTVIRNILLFRILDKVCNIPPTPATFNDKLSRNDANLIISNAKKEFFSSIFSVGFIQLVNLIISAKFPINLSNQYLLFDNLMEQIKNVSRAPFYTKRPSIAMAISKNKYITKDVVYFPILFSHLTFTLGVVFMLLFGTLLLELINSNIPFDPTLWCVIGCAGFIERFTAMHNQLYVIINNKILTHIYMPITAIISTLIIGLFYWVDNVMLFPIAISIGYLIYFSWRVSKDNYNYFKQSAVSFELKLTIPFIFVFILLCSLVFT
jgi:hypothetical protein